MRGYLLPTVIALLLAAPLLWRIDSELSMPNQVIGVADPAETAPPPAPDPAAKPSARLLAVVPVAERDQPAPEENPAEGEARVWPAGFSPAGGGAARD